MWPYQLRSQTGVVQKWTTTLSLQDLPGWPPPSVPWATVINNRAINAILQTDINHVNDKSPDGNTPLHKAVWDVNIVEMLLLLRAGANPNNLDRNENTALHITCINPARDPDLAKMICILLVFGADTDALNADGRTALMYINGTDWDMGKCQFYIFKDVRGDMMQLAQGNFVV